MMCHLQDARRNPIASMQIADFDDVSYRIQSQGEIFTLFFSMPYDFPRASEQDCCCLTKPFFHPLDPLPSLFAATDCNVADLIAVVSGRFSRMASRRIVSLPFSPILRPGATGMSLSRGTAFEGESSDR
jgi:hypothetical protein